MYLCTYLLPTIILLPAVFGQIEWGNWHRVKRQDTWSPWKPPWYNFYPVVNIHLPIIGAWVEGRSVEWHVEDLLWDSEYPGNDPPISEYPPWFMRRINCFLGVPYAEPPVGPLRFRLPKQPRWSGTWDAKYFRPACPQDLTELRKDIPDFPAQNVSEDCLYLNIFVPNVTRFENNEVIEDNELYPVVVYFHGGRFLYGSAQQFPGHVLATREVVVVTVNYRLGALGFLSTEDEHAQGNWGLFDQQQALRFIKDNIKEFRGDPRRITIMGDEAGAVSVGMHLISPVSRGKGFYHQAILMSGTDLSLFGFLEPYWRPRDYAKELADILGCPTHHSYDMMECLRDNRTLSWQRFRDAQAQILPRDGDLGIVWGPVQDGTAIFTHPTSFIFLPESPTDLRRQHFFEHVPVIIGLDSDAGALKANQTTRGLEYGIKESVIKDFVLELLTKWKIIENYRERAYDAVSFQYTYWPDPTNDTARSQGFIDMITDLEFGTGMDSVIKMQADYMPNYVYEFRYKSWHDWVPKFMGTCCSAALPYIFGFPFLNETVLNETELVPRQWFDYDDRNMSEWMMYMWTNFVKYGEPTPNITRNITWEPYSPNNLSYLVLDWHSHIWFRYRQDFYGFWKDYFPSLVRQDYLYPTATPTPAGYEYVIATGSMATVLILLFCGVGVLAFLLWQQRERERMEGAWREAEMPLNVFGAFPSSSTLSKKSSGPESVRSGALPYSASEIGRSFEERGASYEERGRGYEERGRGYEGRGRGHEERGRGYEERGRGYEERGVPYGERARYYEEPGQRERGRGRRYEETSFEYDRGRRSSEGRGRGVRGHDTSGYGTGTRTAVSGTTQHHTVV